MPNARGSEQLMTYTIHATGEITVTADLNPAGTTNRAQAAQIMMNYFGK